MPFLNEAAKYVGLGGVGGALFGNQDPGDPYQAALEAMQRRFDEAKGYITPYSEQGQAQYGRLNEGINQLLNPETLMNRFISSYQESPYTKQLLDRNRQLGLEGASSMGLMGSSAAVGNIQQGAGAIANAQREQYLKDLMQSYLSGLGLSGDIYKTGAGAAESLMKGAQTMGQDEAKLIYGREAAPGEMFNNLLRTAGTAAGAYFGGPTGAYAGSQIGGQGGGYLR